MTPAIFDQTTIDISGRTFIFRATGSVQKVDGFLKLYQEGRDEKTEEDEEQNRHATPCRKGRDSHAQQITPRAHLLIHLLAS